MSDHPENQGKMHDLVRAYAQKRRADAEATNPAPPEMPAAVRQRLLDAVRQQTAEKALRQPQGGAPAAASPKHDQGDGWLARLIPYLPRFAYGFGLLLVLAIGTRMMFQTERHRDRVDFAKQDVKEALSLSEPAPRPEAETVPPASAAVAADVAAPPTLPQSPPLADQPPPPQQPAADFVRTQANPASSPARESPATGNTLRDDSVTRAQKLESVRAETDSATRFNAPAPTVLPSLTPKQQPTPVASPPPAPVRLTADPSRPATAASAPTSRGAPAATKMAKAVTGSVQSNRVVLANFEVIQTGTQLRLIDTDDGSIYEGPVGAVDRRSGFALRQNEVESSRAPLETRARFAETAAAMNQSKDSQIQAAAGWRFRVAGTNRTLQEQVELDGVLLGPLTPTQAAPPTTTPSTGSGQALSASVSTPALRFYRAQPSSSLSVAATNLLIGPPTNLAGIQRIQGTLRVGPTNSTWIDAYRVGR